MPYTDQLYYFDSKPKDADQAAVVLIHGAAGTHLHWPHQLRRLNNHRVLAPDLPGHGKSEGLGEQSIEKYADVIVKWLEKIGVTEAILVGHSMGGAIAQTISAAHPQLVTRLVLVSTGTVLPVNPDLIEKLSIPAAAPGVYDQIVKWAYHPSTDPKLVQQARKQMDAIRHTVTYGDFVACDAFKFVNQLAKIKAPTLVICGDADKMTPAHFSKQLQENLPEAQLALVPDAGHMLNIEQPEKLAQLISEFINPI
ncbi:MAG: alpha/beta hydrolase [Chloroflexota bacterium]